MPDLTNRVSKLEKKSDKFGSDIHDIKIDVHEIKIDVEDGKKVTRMNTRELIDMNKTLTHTNIIHAETNAMFKGGIEAFKLMWRGTKILATIAVTVFSMYVAYQGLS